MKTKVTRWYGVEIECVLPGGADAYDLVRIAGIKNLDVRECRYTHVAKLCRNWTKPLDTYRNICYNDSVVKIRRKSSHGPYCELDGYMVFNVAEDVQYIRQQIARWASAQKEAE